MRFASLLIACLVAHTATASAHIALTFPTPRTADQKAGPCGAAGSTRGTQVSTFRPGDTITVEWDETVDHPGHYRIAFDNDGNDGFPNPVQPDDNFPSTLADQIADKSGGHYTQQITLPNITCTNCTLQLMQVMTTVVPYNSFYFQCADLVLSDSADPTQPPASDGGCAAGSSAGPAASLAALGLVLRRRRRR
ncbi:MAG TPA: SCE4755 family polysaccharide monooxygenase-like protein [Kofleriaceae bacterium]|nr:SCE4755 family polysaccharide monooxygenase-like protein [Kofleriaceae bacterium]